MEIATFDIETDPFEYNEVPKPFACGFYDGVGYYEFIGDDCIDLFIIFLMDYGDEEKKGLTIYAHNGGRFDFHYMLKYVKEDDVVVINGRLAEIMIDGFVFRDSYLLLPLPLSAYKKDDIDYGIFVKSERYLPDNLEKIKKYLKTDCKYLHEWLSKFIDRFGAPLTLPSASFKALRDTGYKITRSTSRYDGIFRDYYFGGRTEVFKSGVMNGDVLYYDINSAYSRAMKEDHPYGNSFDTFYELPDSGFYFCEIFAISRGALPYRDDKGFLLFPNDNIPRIFFSTSWEVRTGLKTGTLDIIKVNSVLVHNETRSFSVFVDKFYEEKMKYKASGDSDYEKFVKLILNSCYGKFALNPRKFKKYCITALGALPVELVNYYVAYSVADVNLLKEAVIMDDKITDIECAEILKNVSWNLIGDFDEFSVWERDDPGNIYYNTATAASITGCVRAFLWETICASGDVIYCDTDSIMCKEFNGIVSNELGDWKLETIFDELFVGGKKLYAGHIKGSKYYDKKNWKKASKGSRLEYDEIIEIVKDNKVIEWKNDAPTFSLKYGARFTKRDIKRNSFI